MNKPFLVTERLELWQPQAADEAEMFAIMQEPDVWRHFGAPSPRLEFNTRFYRNAGSWLLHGYGSFMVRLRGLPGVIGNCGVFHSYRGVGEDFDDRPEAGWIIATRMFGQGIAHEAMRATLTWFDEAHGPQAVTCMIAPENAPSMKLAGKLGFVPTRLATLPAGDTVQLFARDPLVAKAQG